MQKLLLAGSEGMLGKSLQKILTTQSFEVCRASKSLGSDFTKENQTNDAFARFQPDVVVLLAAKVGGIQANIKSPVDFGLDNVLIASNVIRAAHDYKARLIYVGSSCMYPREAPQPMTENFILAGKPEPTNEMYAIAKIYGAKLAEAYVKQYGDRMGTCILPNLYGPNDSFDPVHSHVISATIKKIYNAKNTGERPVIWGTGSARREFMYVDDAARAIMFMITNDINYMINMGTSSDFSILELSKKVASIVGYTGEFDYDRSKPDGMPRKLMDSSAARSMGFSPEVSLEEGIRLTFEAATEAKSI